MGKGRKRAAPAPNGKVFRRYFKHWKTGKVYDAWDYGHKFWPIG